MRIRCFCLIVALLLAVLIAGCSSGSQTAARSPEQSGGNPTSATPDQQPAPSSDTDPGAVTPEKLAKFKSEYELAKTAYVKDPNNGTAKEAYVDTTVRYGLGMMSPDNNDDPKVKYPGALRLFREALKVDPTNAQAKQSKDLIESIYKQMGRPIPN